MVDIQAEVSKDDLEKLAANVRAYQERTGKSIEEAVMFAALKVASSGRSASTLGKTNRDYIDNPRYKQDQKSLSWARRQQRYGKEIPQDIATKLATSKANAPYLILFRGQRQTTQVPSWIKKDGRRKIKNVSEGGRRGLAKTTWNVMAGKVNSMIKSKGANVRGNFYRVSKYREKFGDGGNSIVARLVNELSYLEAAYPGITKTAVQKGARALLTNAQRKIEHDTIRANR